MCHRVRIGLTAEDKAAAKKISGWLIPAYAMVLLAAFALAALSGGPRQGELVASTAAPAAPR